MTTNFSGIGFSFANQSAITHDNGTGYLAAGDALAIQVNTDGPVSVTGTPLLQLNDGRVATYDAATSNPGSLNFIYTVQPGDASNDLRVGDPDNQISGLNLNGGMITSADGTPPAGVVAGDIGVPIDAQPPTLSFNPGLTFNNPGTVTFKGTVADNVGVTNVELFASVNGAPQEDLGPAQVDGNGNWSFAAPFGGPERISNVMAETSDPAGNIVDASGPSHFATGGAHTFVYTANSGPDVINHFHLSGPNHDVLKIPRAYFPNLASLVGAISSIHNVAGGVEIPLSGQDSITLGGITKNQLKTEALTEFHNHMATDFKFA